MVRANKRDKIKVILTALYNKSELIQDIGIWHIRINRRMYMKLDIINYDYEKAMAILQKRR